MTAPPTPEITINDTTPLLLIQALRSFFDIQAQRANAYHRLEQGIKNLSTTAHGQSSPSPTVMTMTYETLFRQFITSLTNEFNALSQKVIDIEQTLRHSSHYSYISDILKTVQENERIKFHSTISWYVLRSALDRLVLLEQQQHQCNIHNGTLHTAIHPGEVDVKPHQCSCSTGSGSRESTSTSIGNDSGDKLEASEDDIKGAIKESLQKMEACVMSINESIMELQEIYSEVIVETSTYVTD